MTARTDAVTDEPPDAAPEYASLIGKRDLTLLDAARLGLEYLRMSLADADWTDGVRDGDIALARMAEYEIESAIAHGAMRYNDPHASRVACPWSCCENVTGNRFAGAMKSLARYQSKQASE
jgi:hypothetical protein